MQDRKDQELLMRELEQIGSIILYFGSSRLCELPLSRANVVAAITGIILVRAECVHQSYTQRVWTFFG